MVIAFAVHAPIFSKNVDPPYAVQNANKYYNDGQRNSSPKEKDIGAVWNEIFLFVKEFVGYF